MWGRGRLARGGRKLPRWTAQHMRGGPTPGQRWDGPRDESEVSPTNSPGCLHSEQYIHFALRPRYDSQWPAQAKLWTFPHEDPQLMGGGREH